MLKSVRSLRLATGLILFAYATSHFLNHAFGVFSINAMHRASKFLLMPWQSYVGLFFLYGSFSVHGLLGLYALYRRRQLRLPASEAWQLALGLAIPFLLIPHAAGLRLGQSLYGMEFGYERILYLFWVDSPDIALPRQMLLLLVVWIHGCIGLSSWLRSKAWYPTALPILATFATLIPTLAILGVISAGLNLREAVQHGSVNAARFSVSSDLESMSHIVNGILILYCGLVAGVFALRATRDWHAKRFRGIRITYPGNRIVAVPAGFSVLEASRWAGIPHESVCGGRGRCSTCRIRVIEGAGSLPAPDLLEDRTLRRVHAPANVRLACQLRPLANVTIQLLVPPRTAATPIAARFDAAVDGGRELEIVAMFVDLRESTALAAGLLPYDAVFLFDRYIQAVTGAIRNRGGYVTSIAGDGVMSVFGLDDTAASSARHAFVAALDVWGELDALNNELTGELRAPIRAGIGIHAGLAVVGWMSVGASQSLQFLGDIGNIAAKLEAQSRPLDCTLVASVAAIKLAVSTDIVPIEVTIPGQSHPISAAVFKTRNELQQVLV
jgi:adenylate cyclase